MTYTPGRRVGTACDALWVTRRFEQQVLAILLANQTLCSYLILRTRTTRIVSTSPPASTCRPPPALLVDAVSHQSAWQCKALLLPLASRAGSDPTNQELLKPHGCPVPQTDISNHVLHLTCSSHHLESSATQSAHHDCRHQYGGTDRRAWPPAAP